MRSNCTEGFYEKNYYKINTEKERERERKRVNWAGDNFPTFFKTKIWKTLKYEELAFKLHWGVSWKNSCTRLCLLIRSRNIYFILTHIFGKALTTASPTFICWAAILLLGIHSLVLCEHIIWMHKSKSMRFECISSETRTHTHFFVEDLPANIAPTLREWHRESEREGHAVV